MKTKKKNQQINLFYYMLLQIYEKKEQAGKQQ